MGIIRRMHYVRNARFFKSEYLKRSQGRPGRRLHDYINVNTEDLDWIDLAQDRRQWHVL